MSRRESSASAWDVSDRVGEAAVVDERFPPGVAFRSVLDLPSEREKPGASEAPAFFRDLNLDQIVASIITGKQEYNLGPLFHRPLRTVEAVEYRQEVMRDLEDRSRFAAINEFANGQRSVRDHVGQAAKMHYKHQKLAWSRDAIELYCQSVEQLLSALSASPPGSAGLAGFLAYLDAYVASSKFQQLKTDAAAIKARLASLRYTMLIGNSSITVAAYDGAPDYGAEIQADFEKFRQGAAADHNFKFGDYDQMNHIEAGVLERVARLFPEPFAELEAYIARSAKFLDPVVARFDREIQFYVAYLVHIRRIGAAGLPFCYPKVSRQSKEENVSQCYDLALARKLVDSDNKVVTNDYFLHGRERIIIVSGPNQGGKTTFARTVGQLHTLAALGCPVPAASAQLFLFDRLFTHFEKGEDLHNLRGKLHDDLYRMHNTLASATSDSIIILNEVFNSTSLSDAIFLSTQILTRIIAAGCALSVRHVHRRAECAERHHGQHGEQRQTGRSRAAHVQGYPTPARRARLRDFGRGKISAYLRAIEGEAEPMKAYLMHRDRDFDVKRDLPPNESDLTRDLELPTLFAAMAVKDELVLDVATRAILGAASNDVATIRYRQEALKDCLRNPEVVRGLYGLGEELFQRQRKIWPRFREYPSGLLDNSVERMAVFVDVLKKVRGLVDRHGAKFRSEAFSKMFATLARELDDDYFALIDKQLKRLKFYDGVLVSAALGKGLKAVDYVLRRPLKEPGNWFERAYQDLSEASQRVFGGRPRQLHPISRSARRGRRASDVGVEGPRPGTRGGRPRQERRPYRELLQPSANRTGVLHRLPQPP